jgi:uncharacterized membrane protein YhaH (DUF805 family)
MNKTDNIPSFWSLVIRFTLIFVIIVMAIEIVFELINKGNLDAVKASFNDNVWLHYLIMKVIIGLAYGIFMAFLTQKRLKKQKRG